MLLKHYCGSALRVSDSNYPKLAALYRDMCKEVGSRTYPNAPLFVAHSDLPMAFAVGGHGSRATIVVSSQLLNILTPLEVKTVLAHEIQEAETLRYTPYSSMMGAFAQAALKIDHWEHARETLADIRATRIEGGAAAMASALAKLDAWGKVNVPSWRKLNLCMANSLREAWKNRDVAPMPWILEKRIQYLEIPKVRRKPHPPIKQRIALMNAYDESQQIEAAHAQPEYDRHETLLERADDHWASRERRDALLAKGLAR